MNNSVIAKSGLDNLNQTEHPYTLTWNQSGSTNFYVTVHKIPLVMYHSSFFARKSWTN